MYASLWTHRRTSSVLLSGLGQRGRSAAPSFTYVSACLRAAGMASLQPHSTRNFSVQTVLPNPSLKLTPNGMARRPVRAGASPHFARPGRRAMPLGAA